MSKKSDLIKKLVKTNVGEKPTFGTNPKDPWSAKANISEESINETALLDRYLKSRGINPQFVSKDQKVAHSKTNQYKTWQTAHINDPIKEETDKKDTVTFDIPLLIRVLELAREDIKSDMDLHRVVERLINMRDKGVLTMDEYDAIAQIKEDVFSSVSLDYIKEALNDLIESDYGARADKLLARSHAAHDAGDKETGSRAHKLFLKARDKHWSNPVNREKSIRNMMSGATQDYKDQEAKRGIGHVRDHVETDNDTQLDETWKYHTYPDNETARKAVKAHHEWRGDDGMASGNPARAMGNNKVAYKGEFKGPKPAKRVSEGVVDAVKKAWKAVSDFDSMQPKYDGNTRRRQALKKKLATDKKKVSEAKEANYGGDYQSTVLRVKEKAAKKPVDIKSLAARMQASYRKDNQSKVVKAVKENMEPQAASAQPCDCANGSDDTEMLPKKKGQKLIQMSKSAKLVKDIYKKKSMKEETYDHEKEDKSVATYGKKPKLQNPGTDVVTKEQPKAAAVLSGGKTLTGEPRDTIEIDPMMKMRKPSPNSQKSV